MQGGALSSEDWTTKSNEKCRKMRINGPFMVLFTRTTPALKGVQWPWKEAHKDGWKARRDWKSSFFIQIML